MTARAKRRAMLHYLSQQGTVFSHFFKANPKKASSPTARGK